MKEGSVSLRDFNGEFIPMKRDDQEMIRVWRNVPSTRNMMFNTQEIDAKTHQHWFNAILNDATQRFYIYFRNNAPLGMLSFSQMDPKQRNAEWGFYKAPNAPKGAGFSLLSHGLALGFNTLHLRQINARVRTHNAIGSHLHNTLGFKQETNIKILHANNGEEIPYYAFNLTFERWQKSPLYLNGARP